MKREKKIPEGTISRLFTYLRELDRLADFKIPTISSAELGERVNLSDAQVRKDLSYFGQFGVSGSGYDTRKLRDRLAKILGKDQAWQVAVVGAGNLGSALLSYPGFRLRGFKLVAAFDSSPEKIGRRIKGVTVEPMERLGDSIREKGVEMAVITVPAGSARQAAEQLVAAGIKCILNFSSTSLAVPPEIKVKDVHLCRELETLSYFLLQKR